MEYESAIVLPTPEGVDVEHPLGGLGSRSAAQLVDLVIESVLVIGLTLIAYAVFGDNAAGVTLAIMLLAVLFLYDVLFEVYGGGATPGKRWVGLRVIENTGHPVGWRSSSIRNAIRLLEGPATLYFVALTAIVLTPRSTRLGDLAAGTVVIRDKIADPVAASMPVSTPAGVGAIDSTAIDDEQLQAVLDFLARRDSLKPEVRSRVASALAGALAPHVVGDPTLASDPERLLTAIAATRGAARS